MDSKKFINKCQRLVAEYSNVGGNAIVPDEVFVVWSCKTLQHHKALLGTPINDGLYFEVTYNGDKHELYFDVYKKELNQVIPGGK